MSMQAERDICEIRMHEIQLRRPIMVVYLPFPYPIHTSERPLNWKQPNYTPRATLLV